MRWRTIVCLIAGAALAFSILAQIGIPFAWTPLKIEGLSMYPTLEKGDFILVYRLDPQVARSDLVQLRYPRDPSKTFVKRVVGLPGERLRIDRNGGVYIDGQALSEPYVKAENNRTATELKELLIPANMYFLMGDNRDDSNDSRFFGPVPRGLIRGKVVARYWPPARIGRLSK